MTERFATQDALRAHIRLMTEGSDLSQKQIAREAGVNDGALNQWLQAKYRGNNEVVFEKLRSWVEYRERSQEAAGIMPQAPTFVSTPTAGRILPVLSYAQMIAEAFGITGKAERDLLADIALKPGALRGMVKVIRNATMFAAGAGSQISSDLIRASWRDLGGEA